MMHALCNVCSHVVVSAGYVLNGNLSLIIKELGPFVACSGINHPKVSLQIDVGLLVCDAVWTCR
jgi:hypothetical protein